MRGTAPVLLALLCAITATPALAQQTARDNRTTTATPQPRNAQPVVTRLRAFAIPFDSEQARTEGAVAVQLLVSADRGGNWQLYATQRTSVDQFTFRTERDGEYWFASRRVLADNTVRPESVSPELKIIVDATPPELDFSAAVDSSGKVSTTWRVTDAHPSSQQVRLEYRGVDEQSWHAVNLSASGAEIAAASGKANWLPNASALFLEVRLQVADEAGNTAESQRRLLVPRVAGLVSPTPRQQPSASPPEDPFSSRRRVHAGATPWPSDNAPSAAAQSPSPASDKQNWRENELSAGTTPAQPGLFPGADAQSRAAAPANAGESGSADSGASASLDTGVAGSGESGEAAESDAHATPAPLTELTEIEPRQEPLAPPVASRLEREPAEPKPIETPVPSRRAPADLDFRPNAVAPGAADSRHDGDAPSKGFPADDAPSNDFRAGDDPSNDFPAGDAGALPAGEQAIMLDRLDFPLAYDVESVGPSGVAQVTLWATRDAGRTWTRWGDDPDRKSPIDVKVAREGTYGFRIVVTNGDGNANDAPVSGDTADVWVCADTTPPVARITAAPYGVGPEAGQLHIEWQAADEHLADRPVTLLFTDNLAGRWTTIAAGLPNSGRYTWRVDPHVPQRVYLRLEVRDKAGNTGSHQLSEPINISGLRPKAHIRGVLPIDNAPRGAMLPRMFR